MRDFESGLTAEWLRERYEYEPDGGLVRRLWPVMTRNGGVGCAAGSVVGGKPHKDGYLYTAINGRLYLVHRIAWVLLTGAWPLEEIDHRNGVRHDNSWLNLRAATVPQNRQNTLGQSTRKGPYPGVYENSRGKFVAQIKKDGAVHYLGLHETAESARHARIAAESRMFCDFAGSNRDQHGQL